MAREASQAQIGGAFYTRAHISAIELGKVSPNLATLIYIAHQLELPVRELIPEDL